MEAYPEVMSPRFLNEKWKSFKSIKYNSKLKDIRSLP